MKEKFNVRILAEIAIFAALGFALDALQGGYSRGMFPSGGSIGIAMLPVFIIGYRRGIVASLLCGLVLSLIQMLTGVYVVNTSTNPNEFLRAVGPFIQVMLDYILGYTLVGVSGAFSKMYQEGKDSKTKILSVVLGVLVGGLLKYSSHVIAGGLFYLNGGAQFWGIEDSSWLFSFMYNGAYCIPNTILSLVLMVIIAKYYPQILNPRLENEVNSEEIVESDGADNE